MRCKNCGWPNEENVSRCIKCNAPLQGSMIESNRQSSVSKENMDGLMTTLRDQSAGNTGSDSSAVNNNTCKKCGYPLGDGIDACPVCQTPVANNDNEATRPKTPFGNNHNPHKGTINPWATPTSEDAFCSLKRIAWQNEHIQYEPVSYSGQYVELNRANTDANNNTITSKTQAVLTNENGEWYVENRSELQTTLIRVDRKVKLEDGDVLVLGNRMFEFKKG